MGGKPPLQISNCTTTVFWSGTAKILRDIPRLSQNEAYVCLGLSELSHSDHILRQCSTKAAEPNISHCRRERHQLSFEFMSKEKFDRFRPPPLGLESLMVWQIEWFGNKTGTTIGTLAVGEADEGWNYAVLGRDKTGDFRVYKLGRDAFSLDDARVEFLLEMAAAERSLAGESENEKHASPESC